YAYQDPRWSYDPYARDPRYMFQDPRIDPYSYRRDPWAYAAQDGQQWYRNYQYSQDPRFGAATQQYIDPRMTDPRYLDPRMDPRLAYRYGQTYQNSGRNYYDPNCRRRR